MVETFALWGGACTAQYTPGGNNSSINSSSGSSAIAGPERPVADIDHWAVRARPASPRRPAGSSGSGVRWGAGRPARFSTVKLTGSLGTASYDYEHAAAPAKLMRSLSG